ncbi:MULTISPECIES: methyltransferase domain-containing protein [unclassified Micromonospora]|uniref:methyltransferase domain-containing protein n=1 Tax=unclassified Micromonospora TaxID=2617518 RepID=UPI00362CBED6
MRLASINLNKRLGNPAARAELTAWLYHHRVDVLIAQEPWKPIRRTPIDLAGFRPVAGDGDLFCWIAERFATPPTSRPDRFAQRLELAWLVIYNTYLDSGSTTTRSSQLDQLQKIITAEQGRPTIACGDFNIAPRPIDGLHNGQASTFNNSTDRAPLSALLADLNLVDSTATDPPQFTIERQHAGAPSQFRCDLALVPAHLHPAIIVRYDHTTRKGEQSFTDHSGSLIDAPVTLPPATDEEQETLFALLPEPIDESLYTRSDYQPHKTAMTRAHSSPFARTVVDVIAPQLGIATILDHGCGRGSDVHHYRASGLDADGWDPHPGFGQAIEPERQYDLVTNIFVLNVLPDPWQRIQAIQHAARFVRPGGHLFVVTRSPADIDPRAISANWRTHHDGYWSSEAKGTFQKGIPTEEIIALGHQAGLRPTTQQIPLKASPTAGQALLVKPT